MPSRSAEALKATHKEMRERIVSRYLPNGELSGGQEFEEHQRLLAEAAERKKAAEESAEKAEGEMSAAQALKAKRKSN